MAAGRQQLFAAQSPERLESMRQVARIQSAEASNAIEDIHAPRARIEKLAEETTTPRNRSEQEIAGYRYVLDLLHSNARSIDFEARYVEQLHGYLARFSGDRTAGRWKGLDNQVEERRPDGSVVVRFAPVSAAETPAAMSELHALFGRARNEAIYHHLLLSAAYVLDFLVIHPFRDGNGRMARLITLWLLYLGGYEVGRFVSLEKLVEESRESYYETFALSTAGWREDRHDLWPWTLYLLGVIDAAYRQFELRTADLTLPGGKSHRVRRFIAESLSNEFTVADIREAAPDVSDSTIEKVLRDLKAEAVVKRVGAGRGSRWQRLRSDFLERSEN